MAICSNSKIIFRKRKGREDEHGGISRMKKEQDLGESMPISYAMDGLRSSIRMRWRQIL